MNQDFDQKELVELINKFPNGISIGKIIEIFQYNGVKELCNEFLMI